jgi:DNA-binding CsgD family transcriptional regulator
MLVQLEERGQHLDYGTLARAVGTTKTTVKHQVTTAMEKTGAFTRAEIIGWWKCELFQIGMREVGLIR